MNTGTCITKYFNQKQLCSENSEKMLYDKAFDSLIVEIHPQLFEENRVFRMSDLLKKIY